MAFTLSGLIIYLFLAYFLYRRQSLIERDSFFFPVLCVLSLSVRLISAKFYYGHGSDMSCFDGWAEMMFTGGAANFYSSDAFTDYPPLYMYVLWLLGAVKNTFHPTGTALGLLLKTPAIICDYLIAGMLYKYFSDIKSKRFAALLWLFNPAVILNSSVWGQVDSTYTALVVFMLLSLAKRKHFTAYITFALAVMLKPQSLFYAPILLFALIEECIYPVFDKKILAKRLGYVTISVFAAILLSLPFGLGNVISQYFGTLDSYNYMSVNAYNLWTALGLNWKPLTTLASLLGTVFIILTVLASAVIFFRIKGRARYFLSAGFICLSVFMLSVKMHERYLYPAVALFLIGAFMIKDKRAFMSYLLVTFALTLNCGIVLFESGGSAVAFLGGIIAVAVFVYVIYALITLSGFKRKPARVKDIKETSAITRRDIVCMLIITAVYAGIALFNLGDMKAPQSSITLKNEEKTFALSENDGVSGMKLYLGDRHLHDGNALSVRMQGENGETVYETELFDGSVFTWEEYEFDIPEVSSVTFAAKGEVEILEAAILDKNGAVIKGDGAVFDESALVPERSGWRNSAYFDEIYHARTAYEFIKGDRVYEWTHPPLGKTIIALGVKIFGMTPFGWRIMGTIFGILMLPFLYILAKQMLKRTSLATFATVLFASDFMHFTQTRIATIDVYITFFGILMYLFMVKFLMQDFYMKEKGRFYLPLVLSGISFGLGTACKWTGLYAGAGLAVILFTHLYLKFREVEDKVLYRKRFFGIIGVCIISFILLPVIIYILSYIPFMRANDTGLMGIWQNQLDMFGYHSGIEATHPYSSSWYEWAVMSRPIWYHSGRLDGNMREGISAFGNPLVWWAGIAALVHNIYLMSKKCCKRSFFLVIAYLAMLLPWVFVSRITFIYHYFPMTPFVCLMIANSAKELVTDKGKTAPLVIYLLSAIALFILFYPVLSGYPISTDYVTNILRWMSGWVLVSG